MARTPAATTAQAIERVALYARVSTEDQADAETIQAQVDFLRRYADLHAIHVVAEYLDDGVSGTIPLAERPHGARLLADAKDGKITTVIFYRVSRLGRRLAVVLDAYEQLDAANVVIRSATEPIDTALPIGRFIFQMLAAFAELDRETIIDNTSRGRARGARAGRWYGVVPTGYTVADGKLVPSEREILPGISEAELVRDIYQRIADGASSIAVGVYLTARGLSRFKRYARHDGHETEIPGAPGWPAKRVSDIIRNPTYRGLHIYEGRHGDIERDVTALVSPDLWERANARLTSNRTSAVSPERRFYLLRSLLRCGGCGAAYIGTPRNGVRMYRCSYYMPAMRGTLRPSCRSKQIPADAIEHDVWAYCEQFIRNPGSTVDDALVEDVARRETGPDLSSTLLELRTQLAGKEQERADILTLMRRRSISLEEADTELADIAAEQDTLRSELGRLEAIQMVDTVSRSQSQAARAMLDELRARIDAGLDDTTRRMVVQALVRRLEVHTEPGKTKRARRVARLVGHFMLDAKKASLSGSYCSTTQDSLFLTREWMLGAKE